MAAVDDALTWLNGVPARVRKAIMSAQSEQDLVDVMGTVKSVEDRVKAERRLAEVEMISGVAGEVWEFKQGNTYPKSYNHSTLFGKFHEKLVEKNGYDWYFYDTLTWLFSRDVLRFSWQYTNLKENADKLDIPITEVAHEVSDGDTDADIGKVKQKSSPRYVAVEVQQKGEVL